MELEVARADARAFLVATVLQPLLRRRELRDEQQRRRRPPQPRAAAASAKEGFHSGSDAVRHGSRARVQRVRARESGSGQAPRDELPPRDRAAAELTTQRRGDATTRGQARLQAQKRLASRCAVGGATAYSSCTAEDQSRASGPSDGYGVSSGGIDGSMVTFVRVSPTNAASSPMHWLASATSCSRALTEDGEDRELVVRQLAVVAVDRGLELRATIATRADGDVDLRELVVEAERLDDVALLARFLEHLADAARGTAPSARGASPTRRAAPAGVSDVLRWKPTVPPSVAAAPPALRRRRLRRRLRAGRRRRVRQDGEGENQLQRRADAHHQPP